MMTESQVILGFRHWLWDGEKHLFSPYKRKHWSSYVKRARGVKEGNHKGLYAYHNPGYPMSVYPPGVIAIKGLVAGSGKTFMYRNGFRSERMQILALANDDYNLVIPEYAKEFYATKKGEPDYDLESSLRIKGLENVIYMPEIDIIELAVRFGKQDEYLLENLDMIKKFFL